MITIPKTVSKHILFIGGKEYAELSFYYSKEDFVKYAFDLSKKDKENILFGRVSFEFKENVLTISEQEKEILEGLHKHAEENYENNGWDYLAECWDTYEKVLEIRRKGFKDIESAIKYYEWICGALNDRRKDIQATAY